MDTFYPSSPGASSSRVTLDDLDAAEQLDNTSVPSRQRPASRRRRTSSISIRRAAVWAISLCLPYVTAANALPSPVTPPPRFLSIPLSSRRVLSLENLSRHLARQTSPWTNSSTGSSTTDSWSNSTVNADEWKSAATWNMPDNFVVLLQRFSPGFIVLSYLIAFVGSLCTLELLIRRTSNAGWRNQLLLASAGICFGAVSTFSMHFIFNQALTLHHPDIQNDDPLSLIYGPGYTVLSLVASCLAMTIAFFVMGTDLGNWCCVFGDRRRSTRSEKETQRQADEYKKWKTAHMKRGELLSRGSRGMGALVAAAGKVAKWSLVEDPRGDQSPGGSGWLTGKAQGKEIDEEEIGNNRQSVGQEFSPSVEEEMIAKDKTLREIDFRFGRTAARVEIARRGELAGSTRTTTTTTDPSLASMSGRPSVDHNTALASMASLSATPAYPPTRESSSSKFQGHVPDFSASSTEVFTPGFNFPPRIDSSTANLLRRDSIPGSINESEASPSWPRRGSMDIPPHVPFDFASRRSSLPTAASLRDGTFSTTLSRIQSLPEADQDFPHAHGSSSAPHSPSHVPRSTPSFSQAMMPTPEMEMGLGKLEGDGQVTFAHEAEEERSHALAQRAKHWAQHGWSIKVQKFLGFDVVTKEEVFKIVLTGTIAGFGVAAMHYIGQLSILAMPYIAYDPAFVVGSVIIAAGAVVIALYIMFIMLRPKLKHGFIYKICVAIILAIAVCCMHFCGMMGTTYAWPLNTPITKHDLLGGTNGAIVGIVSALALSACLACGAFFFVEAIQARRERRRRRRVVVASIMLDDQDRILVNSTDGLPPMCDIASLSGSGDVVKSSRRSGKDSTNTGGSTILGMDLSPGHEAFVNALRLSWFWRNPQYTALNPFNKDKDIGTSTSMTAGTIPDISTSIQEIRRGSLQTMTSSTVGGSSRPSKISVNRFLERFVVSAGQLAVRLTGQEDGIQRLGVLYDQILTTGWVKLSNSSDTVSKGQLIILVRRVTAQQERNDLLTRHFIFADSSAVAVALQRTLSVPLEHMNPLLTDVQRFCDSTSRVDLQPSTLYVGVAVVQATPFDGLRILLEEKNRSLLPMREVCTFTSSTMSRLSHLSGSDELSGSVEDIGEALTWLEGMNLLSIISRNMATSQTSPRDAIGGPVVGQLLRSIERAIIPMLDSMLSQDDMAHIIPRLALHPVLVPLTPHRSRPDIKPGYPGSLGSNTYTPPYMIVLYANYDAAVNTFTDKWLPFNLFRAQNSCVMAPLVGGDAVRPGNIGNTLLTPSAAAGVGGDATLPDGFNPGRRPSKVQFEFPPQQMVPTPTSPPHSAASFVPPSQQPSDSDPTSDAPPAWSGFTFPPRNGPTETSGSSTPVPPPITIPSPPPPINLPAHRLKEKNGPRRSSLAKPRDYGSPLSGMGPDGGPRTPTFNIGEKLREREAPGVAEWDPDWLLILLRAKLRADA